MFLTESNGIYNACKQRSSVRHWRHSSRRSRAGQPRVTFARTSRREAWTCETHCAKGKNLARADIIYQCAHNTGAHSKQKCTLPRKKRANGRLVSSPVRRGFTVKNSSARDEYTFDGTYYITTARVRGGDNMQLQTCSSNTVKHRLAHMTERFNIACVYRGTTRC